MAHRTHSSFNRKPGKGRDWVKFWDDTATRQRHAIADGLSRPAPSGKPPMTYSEHFDLQVQRIKEREAAAQQPEEQTE